MKKKFDAYLLNNQFYDFLNKNNLKQFLFKETRPYIGFVGIEINGMDYAIPLSSDSNNKWNSSKKYEIPIYDNNHNKLDVLKINKMIPIIKNEHFINNIDFNVSSPNFIIKMGKQLQYLNQPEIYDKVHKLANEIYKRRYNATEDQIANDNDLKFAVDFKHAEILMYKYAFELYDSKIIKEEPLLPQHLPLDEFSVLNKYCEDNNINDKNRFSLVFSDLYGIELLRHNNGDIEIVEEIWDSEEEFEDGTTMNYRPWINGFNGIGKIYKLNDLQNISKKDFISEIWYTVYPEYNLNKYKKSDYYDEILDAINQATSHVEFKSEELTNKR